MYRTNFLSSCHNGRIIQLDSTRTILQVLLLKSEKKTLSDNKPLLLLSFLFKNFSWIMHLKIINSPIKYLYAVRKTNPYSDKKRKKLKIKICLTKSAYNYTDKN